MNKTPNGQVSEISPIKTDNTPKSKDVKNSVTAKYRKAAEKESRQRTLKAKDTFITSRYIHVYLDDSDPKKPKVKCVFSKNPFSPAQFTDTFMGVCEAYTQLLLTNNKREDVYEHFNSVFGIFLNKLMRADEIYRKDEAHREFKEKVDATLGSIPDAKDTDANRLAAYCLCRDILTHEAGLTEESADLLLNRRLGLLKPPTGGEADVTNVKETEAKS